MGRASRAKRDRQKASSPPSPTRRLGVSFPALQNIPIKTSLGTEIRDRFRGSSTTVTVKDK